VFDPERDEDPGARRFYVRLLTVVAIAAAGCLALWPSVSGFGAGPDHGTGCIAVLNGWHAAKTAPSAADISILNAAYPDPPTAAQRTDPVFMAQFQARLRAAQALPARQRANDYIDWKDGAGACINESRHRLIRSGVALVSLFAFCCGVAYTRRTRTNLPQHPAAVAGT
jgi:hypothetical protein